MKIGTHDTAEKVFIIAEAGNCHDGELEIAKQMIAAAKKTGADAVKFQAIIPEHLFADPKQVAKYKNICLPMDDFKILKKCADDEGIRFMATHFCVESLDMVDSLNVDCFKISSTDNTNVDLIRKTLGLKKTILISLGAIPILKAEAQ